MKEFEALVGTRVTNNIPLYKIPKGSSGTIVFDYRTGVTVEWDKNKDTDDFDKKTELKFLNILKE